MSARRSHMRSYRADQLPPSQTDWKRAMAMTEEEIMRTSPPHFPPNRTPNRTRVAASSCSAYDCEYVALAEELAVPLVTADLLLLRTFPDIAISPKDFLAGAA